MIVVESFLKNGESPGFNSFADVWNLSPFDLQTFQTIEQNSNFQSTPASHIAYQYDEMYARAEYLREKYPEITFHETNIDLLNTVEGVEALFDCFNFKLNENVLKQIGIAKNTGNERQHRETLVYFNIILFYFDIFF